MAPVAAEWRTSGKSDDLHLTLWIALAGSGVTLVPKESLSERPANCALGSLLATFLSPLPGFFLFFTQRRKPLTKL